MKSNFEIAQIGRGRSGGKTSSDVDPSLAVGLLLVGLFLVALSRRCDQTQLTRWRARAQELSASDLLLPLMITLTNNSALKQLRN